MTKPWITLDVAPTPDGELVLKRHEDMGHIIAIDGRVLMSSRTHGAEAALGALACRGLAERAGARVLLGGLGMGYTLRAVLDALPKKASVRVAELNPAIVRWCRGPLAELTKRAVDDPRVKVDIVDFAVALREAAERPESLDAIAIDLYVGPDGATRDDDPLYGQRATERAFAALKPESAFTVWAEAFHGGYARRLERAGFVVTHERPARGSTRAVVYVGTKPARVTVRRRA